MTATAIESRLRRFLLLLTLLIFLATLTELVLEEHTQEALQFIPFVLCGIGLVSVIAALLNPQRATLLALRGVMALVGAGGILGIALHLIRNLEFEQEIRPNAAVSELLVNTLKGASPLLAPGVMVFAALLALAATYYHPALGKRGTQLP
jgi:hypothetical protein